MPVLEDAHDFGHPVEPDVAWSESYLFGGYDPGIDAGAHARIGIRPNEGTMDVWLDLWLPEGRFAHHVGVREQHEMVDTGLAVGGIALERVEPMRQWRVVGDTTGDLRSHDHPREPGRPVTMRIDAVFEALTPPIGADGQRQPRDGAKAVFHAGHFEQAGRWRGWFEVDGRRYTFGAEARGIRDKSWGPRRWEKLQMWRWFALNFGDDVHLGTTQIVTAAGELHRGWLWRDGDFTTIRHLDIETEYAQDSLHPVRSRVRARDKQGAVHEFRGEMLWVAEPDMYGTWSDTSGRTVIHMGLGRWRYQGRTGYGFADYAHHLDESGAPIVALT